MTFPGMCGKWYDWLLHYHSNSMFLIGHNFRGFSTFKQYAVRQPKSFRETHDCHMSLQVLCSNSIVQNCDKNLVNGRKGTTFNIRAEILTLDYEVSINSTYIRRSCLALLKKRRALLTSLREVNMKLHKAVNRSSNNFILPVSKSPTTQSNLFEGDFRQEQFTNLEANCLIFHQQFQWWNH